MDMLYIAFFREADVVGGFVAEHYYVKASQEKIPDLLEIFNCDDSKEVEPSLRRVVASDKDRTVVNTTSDPPSLSNLLLNAAHGGHRLREIAYVVLDRCGMFVESGLYEPGPLIMKDNTPL